MARHYAVDLTLMPRVEAICFASARSPALLLSAGVTSAIQLLLRC